MALNSIVILGRLTAAPDLKTTNNGIAVSTFSVAVDRDYKSANGERETDFFRVVAWRKTAEFVAAHFRKGDMIGVTGSMISRKYTDKTGSERETWELVASTVSFAGRRETEQSTQPKPTDNGFVSPPMADDDDLPF
jgi:single-strand DNA-binding protein